MSWLRKATLVLLLVGVGWGCAAQRETLLANSPSPLVEQVKVLPGPPNRLFTVVGHITLSGTPATNSQSLITHLREQAAAMGADAVFLGNAHHFQVGAVFDLTGSTRHARGGATADLSCEPSLQARLVRAPRGKTTPSSTNLRSMFPTGIAIAYH
jgi:hypothetical protein